MEEYYRESYELEKQVNIPELLVRIEFGLVECAYYKGDFVKCIQLVNNLVGIKKDFKNLELNMNARKLLSITYRETGQSQKALDNAMSQITISDSLYIEKIVSVTNGLEA